MKSHSRSHLSDGTLLSHLRTRLAQEGETTAELLADIGEVDARRLYVPAGYPSMFAFCVEELHLSEDSAYKRIQVARLAREFPSIFHKIAEGRLHLSGAVLLAPHLTIENAGDLFQAAAHQSKRAIGQLVASRFPRPESLSLVEVIPASVGEQPTDVLVRQLAPGRVAGPLGTSSCDARRSKVAPVAPQRYAYQFNVAQSGHEKFEYLRALLGHRVPSGDRDQVFELAMEAAIRELERRKFGASPRPRRGQQRPPKNPRDIPARVQRAVWQRDGGRCTFVGENGRRCAARTRLEFDHLGPVARGGRSTVANVRLLCRAHNQYQAEKTYGPGFMKAKREDAARAATKKRIEQVIPWLRELGCSSSEARQAAEKSEAIPHAPLEERVRLAVSQLGPKPRPPMLFTHLSQ